MPGIASLDLAISAMDGLFPGADGPAELWAMIARGSSGATASLCERWGVDARQIMDATPGTLNRISMDRAFVLPEAAPDVPGLRVAALPDPRWGRQLKFTAHLLQRMLTRCGNDLDRSRCALVLATSWSDESLYLRDIACQREYLSGRADGVRSSESPHEGISPDVQLELLTDYLRLGGPKLAVDTACSSFLYGLDTAAGLIANGQADSVIVAGVNAFLPSLLYLGFSQLEALSSDGSVRAFDAAASGLVPGEAVSAVLIEPIAKARACHRAPLARLRGLGLSSDGREGAVFSPGMCGQEAAYERAFDSVDAVEVDYVEAHGTGTIVGDGTELESLKAFYGRQSPTASLPLGSIKRLVGHSLAAAGGTSVIKALLILEHRAIPPHPVARPHSALANSCFFLPSTEQPLPSIHRPRRVAVSAFGFGGANGHLVLEEVPSESAPCLSVSSSASSDRSHAGAPPRAGHHPFDMAVMAADAVLAGTCELESCLTRLATGSSDHISFPVDRFTPDAAAGAVRSGATGAFLAGKTTIDVTGWGLGPKPLSEVDAFKLLASDRSMRLIRDHELRGNARTAVVLLANLGGDKFSSFYRGAASHFARREVKAPDLSTVSVAPLLPTLLSGYPSLFGDIKGFHCTLSGGAGAFWDALRLCDYWLRSRCDTILLGAGRFVGSYAELERIEPRALAGAPLSAGEGICWFVLKRASSLLESERPLALVHGLVERSGARDRDSAASLFELGGGNESFAVCELSPAVQARGPAQRAAGHLGEAVGTETLLAALSAEGSPELIEIQEAGEARAWVGLQRRSMLRATPVEPRARLPLALGFSGGERSAYRVTGEPAAFAGLLEAAQLCSKLKQVGCNVRQSLTLRTRAIEYLLASRPPAVRAESRGLRRVARNLVIKDLSQRGSGLAASLMVDEDHPFYFDHPLDHVPGILLFEGALQVSEAALRSVAPQLVGAFVTSATLDFHHYAEKQEPIELDLSWSRRDESLSCNVSIVQNDRRVCDVSLHWRSSTPSNGVRRSPSSTPTLVEKHWVHKARAQNVLVSALESPEGQPGPLAHSVSADRDHAVGDGDPENLSSLYLLEAARQVFMLVAHQMWNVPLETPMSLARVELQLEAPIARHRRLTMIPRFEPESWKGMVQTSRCTIALTEAGTPLGEARFLARAMHPEVYEHVRRSAPRQGRA